MRDFLVALFLLAGTNALAQATMNTSGNWATATNWSVSNIGDLVTETVTISNNISPTVFNGSSFTVGSTSLNNNNTLSINSGGVLNIGNSTNSRNLTTNNNAVITVNGTLEIWGNLVVNNNIVWNISGTVIIHGNVQLNNSANLNVTGGTLQVGGNFTANNNTNISVPSGSISIGGSVNVGNGSNLSGCAGCFHVGGSCTGPTGFCTNGVLPITITNFTGRPDGTAVMLTWSTLTELNFDKFIIERSSTGTDFSMLESLAGHGNSQTQVDYKFLDPMPDPGDNFYRLKAVDYDRSFQYSGVIRVDVTATESIQVFPNPIDDTINVITNFAAGPDDVVRVYNNVGLLVAEGSGPGSRQIKIDKSLGPGIYVLHYHRGMNTVILRLVKK